jgi:putative ABC transport system substrate-binding protein
VRRVRVWHFSDPQRATSAPAGRPDIPVARPKFRKMTNNGHRPSNVLVSLDSGLPDLGVDMKRREFITLIAGAAIVCPLPLAAQQSRLPRIGVLLSANPEPFWSEFRAGLREHGYIEGQNIAFEFRSADGKLDFLRTLADELVRLKVDIIVASQTPAVTAARQATTEIPIVMAPAGDPVATGLISSLTRPGGNITGLSGTTADLGAKTLELLRDVLPSTQRVAVLANAADPFSKPYVEQIQQGGRALGIAVQTIMAHGADEFAAAFAAMDKERADAVMVQGSLPSKPVLDLALKHRLPAVGGGARGRLFAQEGGLLSYSGNQNDMYRRAAFYIDRILKGAKPNDLPVEQPTRYELVINLKTAKALGLTVPASMLASADEVIE